MDNQIIIADFTREAASKRSGEIIKNEIEKKLNEVELRNIYVDFTGITRFASPFFNFSFGNLFIQYEESIFDRIKIENISEVGFDTYQISIENAKMIKNNLGYQEQINAIIKNNSK